MHAQKGPPEGDWRFILTRFDWNPDTEYPEGFSGEVRRSRCVSWPVGMPLPRRRPDMDRWRPKDGPTVEGVVGPPEGEEYVSMVFVMNPHLRTRMVKMGWLDITESWKLHFTVPEPIELPEIEGGPDVAVSPVLVPTVLVKTPRGVRGREASP